tara:strand:- start:300 stop:1304 length:1005 start_codon:yes stop_codon:yes gene_type:complete
MKSLTKLLAVIFAALFLNNIANAACGKITYANMNWASASLMANVDKIILEKGFGCEVELVPGDTMPSFTSMNEKGAPDVAPELWANSVMNPLKKAVSEKRIHIVNKNPISGLGEGWFVNPAVVEKHGIKTVQDLLKRPDLFPHPEDKSKGAFVGCPAGWGCQLINNQLFKAFEMESKGWKLVDPGSAAGLDASMTKANERGENWVGYYWSPTTLIGKYDMRLLDFGVKWGGDDNWHNCLVKSEQECATPKKSSWVQSEVYSVATDNFKKTAGSDAMKYMKNRIYPGAVMNSMLVYMDANQAEGEDAAMEFMTKHEKIWSKWVSSSVAKKIKAGI